MNLETKRLILKPTDILDAEFIYELMNTPKWIENIGDRQISNIKDAKNYIINKMKPQLKKMDFSNNTIIRKSDNKKLGSCGLYNRDGIEGVDIGFALLPQFENFGYALESSQRIIEEAKNSYGVKCISAITVKTNKSSQKLINKLGLKFIKNFQLPDSSDQLMLYRIEL